jgi:tungstate transport system substrate-binding protein
MTGRKSIVVLIALFLGVIGVSWYLQAIKGREHRVLTISTTTSLYDTGLLDQAIAPAFEERTGILLRFIPKGTGAAIQDARNGLADAIIVHARDKEAEFLEKGYGVNRKVIAYNFFVMVGPKDDPVEVGGLSTAEALRKIAEAGEEGSAVWVSRDDGSGTNSKEIVLWRMAGFDYDEIKNERWFRSTGTGMGKTLLYANNVGAYTLSDIGTYLKYFKDGLIGLDVFVEKGEELINIYSIIAVNPERFDRDFEGAMMLVRWLISEEGQRIIGEYGAVKYGRPLFHPIVDVLEKGEGPLFDWIVRYGFIEDGETLTECPRKYRHGGSVNFFTEHLPRLP